MKDNNSVLESYRDVCVLFGWIMDISIIGTNW